MSENLQSPEKQEFESPTTIFSFFGELKDIKNFFRTRNEILGGSKLYNFGSSELSARQVMGPWKFNTVQSLICSIPGTIIAGVMWVLPPAHSIADNPALDPVQAQILSVLKPFVPPFTLLLLVYSVAYCSLPLGAVTLPNWRAAQRKYLYLDGAYGLKTQFLLSLCLTLMSLVRYDQPALVMVGGIAVLVFWGAYFWQGIVTGWKIRDGLFEYDYFPKGEMLTALDVPSFGKFYGLLVVAVIAIQWLLSAGLQSFTYALSTIVHHVRGH